MIVGDGYGFDFGGLDLTGRDATGPFWFALVTDGTDLGKPDPQITTIDSLLADGTIEVIETTGNREMVLRIAVYGEDSYGLSEGEKALMLQTGRRNTVTYAPPNRITGAGEPTVFDVVTSSMEFETSDVNELNVRRVYIVTLRLLPWARSSELVKVTSPAPPNVSPTVVSVDNCSSTTGWSVNGGGATLTSTGSAVVVRIGNPIKSPLYGRFVRATRSGLSAPMTATPFVRIDFLVTGSGRANLKNQVFLNGVEVTPSAVNGTVGFYQCTSSTLTSVEVRTTADLYPNGFMQISIDDVSRTDQATDAIGQRQRYLSIDVDGSARTQGSLSVEDPSAGLGSVLVYTTSDDAVQPPLRARLNAGPTETADTSLVSGKSSDLGTNHVFLLPASSVTAGGYVLLARVKQATAGTYALSWAGKSAMGAGIVDASQSGSTPVTLAANTWTVVQVANLVLPTAPMGPGGAVRVELSSTAGVLLDEAWLINVDSGRLTWVECGTAQRMWITAPTLDTPVDQIWIGNAADQSDAFGAGTRVQSFGDHMLTPPSVSVFAVTTNSVAAAVSASFNPRYHSHVA